MVYETPRELAQSLSDAKRHAVASCNRARVLVRSSGAWRGLAQDAPIRGTTVLDLGRDGLFEVEHQHHKTKRGRATLTPAGQLVAHYL